MIQKHKKYILDSKLKRGDMINAIKLYDSRLKCECVMCYDEFTGKKILNEK